MDFHQIAQNELGTVVGDLVRRLKEAADAELKDVRRELEADLDTLRRQADALREELETESARAATLEADLDSVIEAHRTVDAQRQKSEADLADASRARQAADAEVASLRERLDAARADLTRAHESLEAETALKALVEADLTATRGTLETAQATIRRLEPAVTTLQARIGELEEDLRAARAAAVDQVRELQQASAAELQRVRDEADARVREVESNVAARVAAARDEATGLTARLERSREELAAAHAELATTQSALRQLSGDLERRTVTIDGLERQLAEATDERQTLQGSADALTEAATRLREQIDADAVRLREALARAEAAEAAARLAGEELAASRAAHHPAELLLQTSIRAQESLAACTSVAALIAGLSRQLAPHFARVAVFRVKGNHLEGEQGAGLDPSTDVSKLSIPLGLDSPLTRAVTSRAVQELDARALAAEPSPLGGSPAGAIAVPVVFQGETFAVAYADDPRPIAPSHRAFASLLAGGASVLLGRLTQELKAIKELRDYAALLVQEAQQMFTADLEGGRPESERRKRLTETLACARQLFAQRAELEGPSAARALDDYLLEVMTAPNGCTFASDLAIVLAESEGEAARMIG